MKIMTREKLKILTALAFIAFIAVVGYGSLKKVIVKADSGSCTISGGLSIRADCEGKDVIITAGTVYANTVKVKQSDNMTERLECSDPNDTTCDSHRHFKSLTISGANTVLTHDPVELDLDIDSNNPKNSLTTQATGKTRWKKVDIEVDEGITLSGGAKIDVTGKGYPGGRTGQTGNINSCSWDGKNYVGEDGYGPGPGLKDRGDRGDEAIASGAGFGGKGGVGRNNLLGGNLYFNVSDYPYSSLEWGSGGGSGYSHNWDGGIGGGNAQACSNGGAGGGRIHLKAQNNIEIKDNNNNVKADGANQDYYYSHGLRASGGGGSGGAIWLEAGNDISTPEDGSEVSVEGGGDAANSKVMWAENGEIRSNIKQNNISANGGNGGGGGAGGRIILAAAGTTTPGIPGSGGTTTYTTNKRKIKVQVSWRDASNPNPVELSTILIGLTKQVTAPISGTSPTVTPGGLPGVYLPKSAATRVYTGGEIGGGLCVRKQTLVGYCFNPGVGGGGVIVDLAADQNNLYANVEKSKPGSWAEKIHEVYRYNRQDLTQAPVSVIADNQAAFKIAASSDHIYRMNFADKVLCRFKKSDFSADGCMAQSDWKFPNIPGFLPRYGLDYDNQNQTLYVTSSAGFIAKVEINKVGKWEITKKVDSTQDSKAAANSVATDGNNVYTTNYGWICRWDTNLNKIQPCNEFGSDFVSSWKDLAIDTHNLYMLNITKNFVAKVGKISTAVDGDKITDYNTAIAAYKDQ